MKRMLYFPGYLSLFLIVFALTVQSCSSPDRYNIVEFSCPPKIKISSQTDLGTLQPGIDGKMGLFLSDYSLLSVEDSLTDGQFIYLYRLEDGNKIDIKIDRNTLIVNGVPRSLDLTDMTAPDLSAWLDSTSPKDLRSVRIIGINNAIAEEHAASLKSIAGLNPNVSFLVQGNNSGGPDLLSISRPTVIFLSDSMLSSPLDQLDLSATKVVLAVNLSSKTIDQLNRLELPEIYRLVIGFDVDIAGEIANAFPNYKALSVYEKSDLSDLSSIKRLADLQELHLLFSDTIDISRLKEAQGLEILTISQGIGVFKELGAFRHLKYLNPGEIDEKVLDTILSSKPDLVFLNLLFSDLFNLEPLRKANDLKGIVLGTDPSSDLDLSPLAGLPELQYIGVQKRISQNQELMARIRSACPNCIIYTHDGFCLGSGWLLLFIPALLIVLFFKKYKMTIRRQQL